MIISMTCSGLVPNRHPNYFEEISNTLIIRYPNLEQGPNSLD
jgi:hypothetical protein